MRTPASRARGSPRDAPMLSSGSATICPALLPLSMCGKSRWLKDIRPGGWGFAQCVPVLAMTPHSATPPAAPPGALVAPMPGVVLRYEVAVGDQVKKGDPVVVFEAMKMQNVLASPWSGEVKELSFNPGDKANRGDVLAVISEGQSGNNR